MDILCTFKSKIESQNSEMGVSKTIDHIRIKIKIPNPSQEPPATFKTPKQDLEDMDVLCTFRIKIESQNSEYGCIKDQWPYGHQDQDPKPQSGLSKAPNESLKDMDVLCSSKIKI